MRECLRCRSWDREAWPGCRGARRRWYERVMDVAAERVTAGEPRQVASDNHLTDADADPRRADVNISVKYVPSAASAWSRYLPVGCW